MDEPRGAILLVDFKLTEDDQLQVLEFGCGTNSQYKGYNQFFDDNHDYMHLKIIQALTSEFDQVICIDAGILNPTDISQGIIQTFNKSYIHSLAYPHTFGDFYQLLQPQKTAIIHYAKDTDLAYKEGIQFQRQLTQQSRSLKGEGHIFMNGAFPILLLVMDKWMYSQYAKYLQWQCKPHDQLLHLDFCTKDEIETLVDQFPDNPLIIKPIDGAQGEGVFVVHNKIQAITYLEALKTRSSHHLLDLTDAEKKAMIYWSHRLLESDRFCLLQTYVEGKNLEIQDKIYQPTGRLVFYVYYLNQQRYFKIIDAYWKLPRQPFNVNNLSIENAISHMANEKNNAFNSALMDEKTKEIVKGQFEEKILPFLDKVFFFNVKKIYQEMKHSSNELERRYAKTKLREWLEECSGLQLEQTGFWAYLKRLFY